MNIFSVSSLRVGSLSTRWRPRIFFTTLGLLAATMFVFALSLALGDYQLSLPTVFRVLAARASSSTESLVVWDWRMPRSLAGLSVGAALGLSGALTQSATRNALASPDILGFTSGASAAALTVTVLGAGGGVAGWLATLGLPLAALGGGLVTAVVIGALAFHRQMDSYRLVLCGIVINALLLAYINFLLIKADLRDATTAQFWLHGSLGAADWERVTPLGAIVLVCLLFTGTISFRLKASSLGEALEHALGQRPGVTQMILLAFSVLLASAAVAAAGPIGFVAFVAPQLTVRLSGISTPPFISSALMGSCIVLAGDIITQDILPVELPVGLMTSSLGGVFLIYLLVRANRKATV